MMFHRSLQQLLNGSKEGKIVMKKKFMRLDKAIQEHLISICKSAGLKCNDKSLEILASEWMAKERVFLEQSQVMGLEGVEACGDSERGFIALTYSGSLMAIGPESKGSRRAVYVSINRRQDVPSRAEVDNAVLDGAVEVGKEIIFSSGPVQRSSAVYKLAILPKSIRVEEQNTILDEATLTLTSNFQSLNEASIIDA